ncbi:MAG: RHS repeat-associated core domain-containing protein [Muribaculaceae bacterium]|nr:RHS repeat-associated core domain-containing protein [Muribaculaceae bacterium]
MKHFLSIMLLMLTWPQIHAEAPNVRPEENSWPETPQARGISEVMMESPSLLTGACEFNIPLYTISVEGFNIPVSLNYHSNGIRMTDDPQPIGHGWSLTPPLRISRQIMGRPDDLYQSVASKGADYIKDAYSRGYYCIHDRFATGYNSQYRDTQYDIFTIYLLDATLTAIYKDGKFLTPVNSEYRITATDGMGAIIVTDPQGNRYNFATPGSAYSDPIAQNDWMLTSIKLRSGTMIEFEWCTLTPLVHSLIINPRSIIYNVAENFIYDFYEKGERQKSRQRGTSRVQSLKSIKFPGGKLTCNYSTTTVDNNRYTMLYELKVANDNSTIFSATLGHTDPTLLSNLQIDGGGTHRFTYYPLPSNAHESSSDWWGYYNGKDNKNSHGYYLSPQIELRDLPGKLIQEGANRSVDAEASKARMLQSVTHPTGGVTRWEYEPHKFNAPQPPMSSKMLISNDVELTQGGGNRVKAIKQTGTFGTRTRRYTYGENNNGLANIEAAPTLGTFIDHNYICLTRSSATPGVYAYSVDERIIVSHQSKYLDDQPGLVPIWYSKVTETDEEGRIEYEFKMIAPRNQMDDSGSMVSAEGFSLHTPFSKGPQMVKKTIYRYNGLRYTKVEDEEYNYCMVKHPTSPQVPFFKVRRAHTVIDGTDAPDYGLIPQILPPHDFSDGHRIIGAGDQVQLQSTRRSVPPITAPPSQEARFWFNAADWTLHLATEQLKSVTHHSYLNEGTITTTERNTYIPGTSLLKSSVTTLGTDSIRTDYSYTPDLQPDLQRIMTQRNITGLPTSVTETYRSASAGYSLEFNPADSTMHPRRVWQHRNGNKWSHNTYTYNQRGYLTSMTTPTGVTTHWMRDSLGNPIQMNVADGLMVSHATWTPLVGVTSLKTPIGGTETFTYDQYSRLKSRSFNSRLMQQYDYNIGYGGNYILTTTHTSSATSIRSYAYFDLLGHNHINQTEQPDGSYLSTLTEYDNMGRPCRQWLPVATSENPDPQTLRQAASDQYAQAYPWEETIYEKSPRALPIETIPAGDPWHTPTIHSRRQQHHTNASSGATSAPLYVITSDGVKTTTNHPAATLSVTSTTDEDGNTSTTWTNLRGQTLQTTQGSATTHYIYNDNGDLAYILPPGLTGTHSRSDREMQQLAYWYDYDSRGRLITKKLPGLREIYYIYDPADRLIAQQSASLPSDQWRIYAYDKLNRQTLTLDCTISRQQAQQYAQTIRNTTLGGPLAGYSLPDLPDTSPTIVCASYYDNYSFINTLFLTSEFKLKSPKTNNLELFLNSCNPAGLLTGTYTGQGYEVYYYDNLGQIIQRYATGFNTGRTTNIYNYTGQITTTIHESDSEALGTTTVNYTYDSASRPTETKITKTLLPETISFALPKAPGITIRPPQESLSTDYTTSIKTSYNTLGQIATTTHGPNTTRTYSYTPQGWLNSTTTTLPSNITLTEKLHYNTGSLHPSFNGNISAKEWDTGRYDYTYDNLNRLIEATFDHQNYPGDFTTSYTYDLRGNPLAISRQGEIDPPADGQIYCGDLDLLTMTYTGNQLTTLNARTNALAFEGQTGVAQNGRFTLGYDSAGRLVKDQSRNIRTIEYDNDNHPIATHFYDGTLQTELWDGLGNHISTTLTTPQGETTTRLYTGSGQILVDGTATIERTPGGYFDYTLRKFRHYITDHQGNNTAIVTDSGTILQQTHYYPYGEPLREPVHPFTFSDNERLRDAGQNQYDFHARRLIPTLLRFDNPDPLMEKTPWNSPYLYCSGNPVNKIDPLGLTDFVCMETETKVYVDDGNNVVLQVTKDQLNQLREVHFDSQTDAYIEVVESAIVRNDLFPTVENVLKGRRVVTWADSGDCLVKSKKQNNVPLDNQNQRIDTFNKSTNTYDFERGTEYIVNELISNHSVVVGVNHNAEKPKNNNPSTDHFLNIVGMGFDFHDGSMKNFFSYYDNATSDISKVTDLSENRFYVMYLKNGYYKVWYDNTKLNHSTAKRYILSEVRKNAKK